MTCVTGHPWIWWAQAPRRTERGGLRIAHGAFADRRGPILPVLCHAGDLLALFARDRAWALRELDAIARAGYDGVRTWTWLAGPYWEQAERTIGPDVVPDYWALVRAFADALRARDLWWLVSQGDLPRLPRADAEGFMRRLGAVLREAGGADRVCGVDAGNEAWNGGEADPAGLRRWVDAFRAELPVDVWSLTSAPSEEVEDLDRYAGSVYDVHGDRSGHVGDKVRHAFSIAYEGRPRCRLGVQSEPPGAWSPGSLVSAMAFHEEMDGEAIALLTAIHLLARQASVYFSSPGVRVRERGEFRRMPGFETAARVGRALPADLMTFRALIHGGSAHRGRRVLAASEVDGTLIRVDQAIHDDGRFVAVIYPAAPGEWRVEVPVERDLWITELDPERVIWSAAQPRRAGESVALRFRHGRVVMGRIAS